MGVSALATSSIVFLFNHLPKLISLSLISIINGSDSPTESNIITLAINFILDTAMVVSCFIAGYGGASRNKNCSLAVGILRRLHCGALIISNTNHKLLAYNAITGNTNQHMPFR